MMSAARAAAAGIQAGASPMIWINGVEQQRDGPHVSASDRGLTLADGAFETMRVVEGAVFRLDRHLARLREALERLAIPVVPELREWAVMAARAASGEMSVRLTVTRGVAPGGARPPSHAVPTVIVALNPMPYVPPSTYDRGLALHVASGRRNEHAITARLKTLAYTEAVMALVEADRTGADDALFLDMEGHCSEASSSNLFMVSRGDLVTPPITCGALPGITRAAVLELAQALGLRGAERPFRLDDVLGADEAFLTSTLRGIAPIARIGREAIGTGAPGPLTRRVSLAYRALVTAECSR